MPIHCSLFFATSSRTSAESLKRIALSAVFLAILASNGHAAATTVRLDSPNGRNSITLHASKQGVFYSVARDGQALVNPSRIAPQLAATNGLDGAAAILNVERGQIDEEFLLPWGKTDRVQDRCATAVLTLSSNNDLRWQIELRAYDDGVAFRYRLLDQLGLPQFTLRDEATEFDIAGKPIALFNSLENFTSSHESLYQRQPLESIPAGQLFDCPLLFVWPGGPAAAITEARVRNFAGMYLSRESPTETTLRCRLSPLPSRESVCVEGQTPHASPWRVLLLADSAGRLLESNLLLCLNDPPAQDFAWARPGKSTFHWWYGEFEDDHELENGQDVFVDRHCQYIDFCAENNIAYHAVSGDGLAWYEQSSTDYAVASDDADVRKARPELGLPRIFAHARQRGVGIRLWVHWKALNQHLEEAMSIYESWGVKGLMVDFLDRDDQEMIAFSDRMLASAARHKIHIQIHGSSKYSGEQRTFANLFNREGVLNLEYVKWSNLCTPDHSVNVAYTRALAGPVDFHLGGFRSVSRETFKPRDRAPVVMGTRCHNLALYVVYENPMPMVADAPQSYVGQQGFEFIRDVPTTWNATRFVMGEPGEYIVVARRNGAAWYLGGITNWNAREIEVPMDFLDSGKFRARWWVDGSQEASRPNAIREESQILDATCKRQITMAPGGGFVAKITPE